MSRKLRYQPDEWMVHFVTVRCLQGRYLLRPSPRVRQLCVGVLERAAERTGCRLHGAVALSGHMHLLVSSESAAHLADYMEFVNGNIAREIGKLHRWRGKFWHRRYSSGLCLDDAAQVDRLAYLLAHRPKEGLVRHARDWPGLHTFRATCDGEKLHGVWVDRTAMYDAACQGDRVAERNFETPCTLTLHKLPCWAHLDDSTYAADARRLYHERVALERPNAGARCSAPTPCSPSIPTAPRPVPTTAPHHRATYPTDLPARPSSATTAPSSASTATPGERQLVVAIDDNYFSPSLNQG